MPPISSYTDHDLLELTPAQVRLISCEPERAEWAMLRLQALARKRTEDAAPALQDGAGAVDVSTPSAMIAPYLKPNSKKKPRPRGRPEGHAGSRRAAPLHLDHHVEHAMKCCPDCGHKVTRRGKPRTRVIEDIQEARAEATEHTIPPYYCRHCKKRVEPKVTQALPKSTIGNRALAMTAWLHYGLGNTVSQVQQVLAHVFQLPLSGGGLTQQWQRLGDILDPWYQQIGEAARSSAVLNVDESGWRVNGSLHWLWCFTSPGLTYYIIARSRAARVPVDFLDGKFKGTLVSDFYGAYNKTGASRRQVCLVHLLREIKRVSEHNNSEDWRRFAAPLKRIIADAYKLGRRTDRDARDWLSKRDRVKQRLEDLCWGDVGDGDECRLMARLIRHEDAIFTFLDDPAVPPDNNRAEREIRPAVIARKNSFHNTSDAGAHTQAVMMSLYRTLKRRGLNPLAEITRAIEGYIRDGKLPPLPQAAPTSPPPAQPDG